ncbi:Tetratricopeptide TPR_2 repeat protein [Gluconacetobacter diazotrophicus PA1 5]|uniref:Glycosyltransferase family protein n=2 Tax=Gluconacetobacter diazotrophicus TaxID=33996 RepID=A0A7W4I5H4_GLUDI|nr:Tetratricopeptide TPR_2 repeat protein [Gluconacetobacter diazotrophicus PA1 5]MBB2156095.1 glycosyltransferase family protein [Gluconacetobacter diazotrophicus]TWB10472.1 glycosyl transferase family 9 (putative heptosyltransferase) [Gluconacetobacter diazotrophicus]
MPPLDVDVWLVGLLQSPTPKNLTQVCETFFSRGQGRDAARLALEVVSGHPDDAALALAAAALISKHTARHDVVATLLQRVLRLEPNHILARLSLADALVAGGDVAGGCAVFSEMMVRYPAKRTDLCEHISVSFLEAGYPLEALQVLSFWLKEGEPNAALANNMGCTLQRLGRSAEAIPWYKKALMLAPENPAIAFGYALALLKAGNFREGWARYVERVPMTNGEMWFLSLPRLRLGDDVAGKNIIVYQEQGLGDTLQFVRFVPYLVKRGAKVTIAVPASLARLLALSFPDMSIISILSDFGARGSFSYAVPIPDLPFVAGVMSECDVSVPIPYLRADPGGIAKFAAALPAGRPRIGLVWAGDRRVKAENVATDKRRSMTLAEMAQALSPVSATLVSLQFGPPREEIAAWEGQKLCDPMDSVRDMADTAAIMENLDLVISVDTSPLHLAGALGRPVWLISRRDACWRWGDEGATSAWYPTMRLFRAREKSFASVLREVGAALHDWVAAWNAGC